MGTYRSVSVSFWTDTKVYDDFSWAEKYLYLYFLTNPHTNICGCYEISRKQIAQETGLDRADLNAALDRLERVHQVIRYCSGTKELLILNWSRYNWSNSDKLRTAVLAVARHIKHPEFRAYVLELLGEIGKKERTKERIDTDIDTDTDTGTDTGSVSDSDVSIGYGYPMDTVSGEGQEAEAEGERQRVEAAFNMLWSAYPAKRRANRAKCLEAFRAVTVPLSTLMDALERQKGSQEWTRKDGKYIPGLYKWITEERWEAAPEAGQGFTMSQSELAAIREMERQRGKGKKEDQTWKPEH